jgi:hypothetical protein
LDPASGVRRVKLRPHDMTEAVTATDDLFVLAHLGIPRVDPAHWSLAVEGLIGRTRTLSLDDPGLGLVVPRHRRGRDQRRWRRALHAREAR